MSLITESMNEFVADIQKKLVAMGRPLIADMFPATYLNTIETTVTPDENGVFVITGDIPAMWLRDSSAQVRHYLPLTKADPQIRQLVDGLVKRQAICIKNDPYANAFNRTGDHITQWQFHDDTEFRNPMAWERKYEVDSLCAPLYLARSYYRATADREIFTEDFHQMLRNVFNVFKREQEHASESAYFFRREDCPEIDTLPGDGRGNPVTYTGMTWSGFRPSDDRCKYGYLVPANMMAVVALKYAADFAADGFEDVRIETECRSLAYEIDEGIKAFGTYEHEKYGEIYVYETDGGRNMLLMDDANSPSLLAAPYLGYTGAEDPIYRNTRRFVLSTGNPWYFEGTAARGVGSPHTGTNRIWPISVIMQALTSTDEEEIHACLQTLAETHAGTGYMHESFDKDDPTVFTRPWFAWANSLFAELLLRLCGE